MQVKRACLACICCDTIVSFTIVEYPVPEHLVLYYRGSIDHTGKCHDQAEQGLDLRPSTHNLIIYFYLISLSDSNIDPTP